MPQKTDWAARPERLDLPGNEAHVWRASLDLPRQKTESLYSLLSADEQERAARFHFLSDRERFIISHGILRTLLGDYLGQDPSSLTFCHNAHGKPSLAKDRALKEIQFNLSHSEGLALYVFTLHREVGVDLEFMRADFASTGIAERFFSPSEVAALQSFPLDRQVEAFFNCWTRKEAYLKARGDGLSFPLDGFAVSVTTCAEEEVSLNVFGNPHESTRWSLQSIAAGDRFAAAVAIEGPSRQLKYWQF